MLDSSDCLTGPTRSRQPSFTRLALTSSKATVMPCRDSTCASASPCQNSSRFHMVMKVPTSGSLREGLTSMSRR